MNIRRIIFLTLFSLFQISVFIFTLYVESKKDDFNFLLDMMNKISIFKYGALIGVAFVVVELIWARSESKNKPNF
ncbi:MAG: hypothetical protein OJF59_000542 [Cytophagales bacterium]|jgi:uncharacterized membrane protein YbhN (UPF0104 family)|nr:hypothetical protein [Bacteroidota bacterium]MBS1981396.1 hypothetical protein [Bacteroidota bacterium]WHZ06789.1 MAG: hypothetical protein OJF59_000542 [Cytophagales bacterium]